jgi:hypothetical protein
MGCGASVQSAFTRASRKKSSRPLTRPAGRILSQMSCSEAVVAPAAPRAVAERPDPDAATPIAATASAMSTSASAATAAPTTARLHLSGGRGQKHAGYGESANGIDCEKRTCRQHTRQSLPQTSARVVGHHIRCLQFSFATANHSREIPNCTPWVRSRPPSIFKQVSSVREHQSEARRAPTQRDNHPDSARARQFGMLWHHARGGQGKALSEQLFMLFAVQGKVRRTGERLRLIRVTTSQSCRRPPCLTVLYPGCHRSFMLHLLPIP